MEIGKSFFPVNHSFSAVSEMRSRMDQLSLQLATGKRVNTLSELGNQRVFDLTVRARLGRIDAFQSNIQQVDIRLSVLDIAMSRLDGIEADSRSAVSAGGPGADGVNMAVSQSGALARLDEVVDLLRSHIGGRYLFAGANSDTAPVDTLSNLLDGTGSQAGFRTVLAERILADAGADGKGRTVTDISSLVSSAPASDTVALTEPNPATSPYGPSLASIATNSAQIAVTGPAGGPPAALSVQFTGLPADGEWVQIGVESPDGTVDVRQLTAVTGVPANPGEFQIGADADATAINFKAALDSIMAPDEVTLVEDGPHAFGLKLDSISSSTSAIEAATTPVAATTGANTFTYAADASAYGVGDTTTFDISVDGGGAVPITIDQAAVNGVGNGNDVIDDIDEMTDVLTATLGGGVTVTNDGTDITITSNTPGATSNVTITNFVGDGDVGAAANTGGGLADGVGTTGVAVGASQLSHVRFDALPAEGDTITIGVTMPDGSSRDMVFTATTDAPTKPGQFQIGADTATTTANFKAALDTELERVTATELRVSSTQMSADNFFNAQGETVQRVDGSPATATGMVAATSMDTVSWYVGEDSTNARQTVSARIDEGTQVNYGVLANETGFVELMRSLATMAVADFSINDPTAEDRYELMTAEQTIRLSEGNNGQSGSIEAITLELGITQASVGHAKERHNIYKVQLDTIIADIEQAPIEEVAAQILSLETRLQASYQTMSIVANLSLVNFLR